MVKNKKDMLLLKSEFGSVFSVFSEDLLKAISSSKKRNIAVYGKVNNPGIIEVPENYTINYIIEQCGGIIHNIKFKAAHIGMPFGGFITKDDVDKELDFSLFAESKINAIIILSEEDCIIQYAKFYIEYLLERIDDKSYIEYEPVKDIIKKIFNILDRISKGSSNLIDVYALRSVAETLNSKMKQQYNIVDKIIDEIIENFYEEIEEHIEEKKCYTSQCNHLVKITITERCIGCGSCKRTCPVDCIEGELRKQHNIDYNRCTHCGACISVCPVDAITAGDNTLLFLRDLALPDKVVITQMAPAIRVTIGEAFGFDPGENIENKLAAGLRRLGVDYVFDTTYAADFTIMEEAAELKERFEKYLAGDKDVKLPILTSCCPAWVKFIEQNYPDMLDVPSSAKSPMQMFAAIAKEIWAKEKGLSRDQVTSVAIMPCVAKKYEASRIEFSMDLNYDVDYVITTRELIKLFQDSNIDLKTIEEEEIDRIMGEYTGAGIIFGRTGGVIEAATRTAYEWITGKKIDVINFEPLRGWDNFRICELDIEGVNLRIGIVYGLREAAKMLDKIRSGEEFFHAIEIMACQCGCVGGGGQPKVRKNREQVLKDRAEGLNSIDKDKILRRSNENPEVITIYDKYLGKPLSHKAHELLHTNYFPRLNK